MNMIRRGSTAVLSTLMIFFLCGLMPPPAAAQTAKPATKSTARKAAPTKEPAGSPMMFSLQLVRVKPDMLSEWTDLQKEEAIPALKKGGVPWRAVWQTAVFGEAYEFVMIQPIENFKQFDGDSPMQKALGQAGLRTYAEKLRRMVVSSRILAMSFRPDLSIEHPMTAPPKMAVVSVVQAMPGRQLTLENLIRTEVVPAMKKAGVAGYHVNQTVLGGSPFEYVTVVEIDNFADLDKGSPFVRALGKAGADQLTMKLSGVVSNLERFVSRYSADLSFGPDMPAK